MGAILNKKKRFSVVGDLNFILKRTPAEMLGMNGSTHGDDVFYLFRYFIFVFLFLHFFLSLLLFALILVHNVQMLFCDRKQTERKKEKRTHFHITIFIFIFFPIFSLVTEWIHLILNQNQRMIKL